MAICAGCRICSQRLTTFVLMPVRIQTHGCNPSALCGQCHGWGGVGSFKSGGEGSNAESLGSEQYHTTPTFSHTFNYVTQWLKLPDSYLIVPGDPFSLETYHINKHISSFLILWKEMYSKWYQGFCYFLPSVMLSVSQSFAFVNCHNHNVLIQLI